MDGRNPQQSSPRPALLRRGGCSCRQGAGDYFRDDGTFGSDAPLEIRTASEVLVPTHTFTVDDLLDYPSSLSPDIKAYIKWCSQYIMQLRELSRACDQS